MKKEVIALLTLSLLLAVASVVLSPGNHKVFGSAVKIGDIVYNLSMAYIASFIFYFLLVFLPDQRNKKNISPYIKMQTDLIGAKADTVFEHIKQKWNHELKLENANADDLTRMLACINPYDLAPLVHPDGSGGIRQANWTELFTSAIRETRTAEEKILSHSLYLDAEIIKRTRAVTSCPFFSVFELATSARQANSDLSAWGPQVFEWIKLCKELRNYTDRELTRYLH